MFLRSYLQNKHALSRRMFTGLVDNEKIFVNQQIVNSYKQEVQANDELVVNDSILHIHETIIDGNGKLTSVILIFNKPKGYVVSKSDPHNKTIYELLPKEFQKYYSIGRLDKDSHGLLLLTNDPILVNQYEHPRYEIEKEYIVKIDRAIDKKDLESMMKGTLYENVIYKVKNVQKSKDDQKTLNIVLSEGKKRHIRMIFRALGYRVLDLQRIREGKFVLGELPLGECKETLP